MGHFFGTPCIRSNVIHTRIALCRGRSQSVDVTVVARRTRHTIIQALGSRAVEVRSSRTWILKLGGGCHGAVVTGGTRAVLVYHRACKMYGIHTLVIFEDVN